MHRVTKFCSVSLQIWEQPLVTLPALFLSQRIFPSCSFPSRLFFCLCCSFCRDVSRPCVHRDLKFSATSSLALQAPLASSKPLVSPVLRLNMHLVFILAPSMALLLDTSTLFADGHLWPELCENLGVFIIQRACSLCCFSKGGGAKVCVW